MSSPITLAANIRTEKGRKNYLLREQSQIPAVVYGAGFTPMNIRVDRNTFLRVYKEAGESTIIELSVDAKTPVHALIQDYQLDPVRNDVIHIDFRAVDMTREIEAEVALHFVGESVAVKALGGTLVHPFEHLRVRSLPTVLPRFIEVDLSRLTTFEDAIHVEDLVVPDGVKILEEARATVALVAQPRTDAEMAELEAAVEVDVTKIEVTTAKKEEESGAEVAEGDKAEKADKSDKAKSATK